MEDLVIATLENKFNEFYSGKRVFLTGHTGFKGGWLALWLHDLGAAVHGYALDPPTDPCLFEAADVAKVLASDTRGDLDDLAGLKCAIQKAQPEIVFHLAAQPLVRAGYRDPLGTLATNIMGTAHVLEALRHCDSTRAIVVVTTDKVYQNHELLRPYREADPLGGHDPYSASKASAEIVAASYRTSFFNGESGHPARIATARAGNVIGGGDWAADRLIPDCLTAFARNEAVELRFPHSVRPWQHVLEPLAGYLNLGERLSGKEGSNFATAWNFGPGEQDCATVGEIAANASRIWGATAQVAPYSYSDHPHEARLLRLDSVRAQRGLGWRPRWSVQQALSHSVAWHKAWISGADMAAVSLEQIRSYVSDSRP